MRKTKTKIMVPTPLKLLLLLVLAAVVLCGYSATAQVVSTDNQQADTTQSVTILDPFELIDVTATVTETEDGDWYEYHHQWRWIRTEYKPPL